MLFELCLGFHVQNVEAHFMLILNTVNVMLKPEMLQTLKSGVLKLLCSYFKGLLRAVLQYASQLNYFSSCVIIMIAAIMESMKIKPEEYPAISIPLLSA